MSEPVYVYRIGYGSPEDSDYSYYEHTKKYNQGHLENIVVACAVEALRELKAPYSNYQHRRKPHWSDIIQDFHFEGALKDRGFKKIKPHQTFSVFGWSEAETSDDWKSYKASREKRMAGKIRKKLRDVAGRIKKGLER